MYIQIEGPDAVGKTTITEKLERRLGNVERYFDPGISEKFTEWQKLRQFVKNIDMSPMAETMMFFSLRQELMVHVEKSLNENKTVIQDRGPLSTFIYQGLLKGQEKLIEDIEEVCYFRKPDMIFLFMTDWDTINERILKRDDNHDKFKKNSDFRKKVYDKYWEIAYGGRDVPYNVYVIDTTGDVDSIVDECIEVLEDDS
jgi:dTMP kinase